MPLLTEWWWLGLIVFLRIAAMMAVLPGLGEQTVPMRLRLALGLMLTLTVMPAIDTGAALPALDLAVVVRALLTESVIGLILGLWLRLFIHALQTAGSIAAQATSLAQLLGNSGADPMPAIGHVLSVAALALLMVTGFHVKVAAFLILSFDLFPPLIWPDPGLVAQAGRAQVAMAFTLAFTLAAPFVILSALYNLTLGFINKAMPQLMVAFVGAPVITFGSIALLLVTAPLILSVWLGAVDRFLAGQIP
ncbi:flagellar biosynthetic protein FliR [Salipiger bermudensis]|nr:flagellar biosynthetic protein FliR [Salipiger bermudensis]MBY6003919.1 flagellar biosynthetic protein FliR [Salipiger bermudensis]